MNYTILQSPKMQLWIFQETEKMQMIANSTVMKCSLVPAGERELLME